MMRKILFTYLFVLLNLFSISSVNAEEADMRNTYAVMWTIDTNDTILFKNTLVDQTQEMLALWQNGTLENVYLDNKKIEDTVQKGEVGKVMFFIKAKTETEARQVLDELPLVEKKVATYNLYPVGVLWLKQF
ncbi:hypothetical protein [Vibrio sp. VB16]|uniref:hypothetical protein n=1 Tax=Vibrio sp. VB16 TaxID=2785746 RepID=UPI001E49139E|nr:hypothetical protein [Vibrio sp. VB16]UGA56179.1 hypothetical protein IUZ65_007480 [Vibrio sp. VB16]